MKIILKREYDSSEYDLSHVMSVGFIGVNELLKSVYTIAINSNACMKLNNESKKYCLFKFSTKNVFTIMIPIFSFFIIKLRPNGYTTFLIPAKNFCRRLGLRFKNDFLSPI
jgi:hypothetical protein